METREAAKSQAGVKRTASMRQRNYFNSSAFTSCLSDAVPFLDSISSFLNIQSNSSLSVYIKWYFFSMAIIFTRTFHLSVRWEKLITVALVALVVMHCLGLVLDTLFWKCLQLLGSVCDELYAQVFRKAGSSAPKGWSFPTWKFGPWNSNVALFQEEQCQRIWELSSLIFFCALFKRIKLF